MKNFIQSFLTDTGGAAAAEYALILAIVGVGIATAASGLSTAISDAMDKAAGKINAVP